MVFRISKIHTNADFTFSNNKNLEKAGRILVFQSDLRYNIDVCYLIYGIA